VVEHDTEMILAANHVLDFGPGAGKLGGRVVSAGTPEELLADPRRSRAGSSPGKRASSSRTRAGYRRARSWSQAPARTT